MSHHVISRFRYYLFILLILHSSPSYSLSFAGSNNSTEMNISLVQQPTTTSLPGLSFTEDDQNVSTNSHATTSDLTSLHQETTSPQTTSTITNRLLHRPILKLPANHSPGSLNEIAANGNPFIKTSDAGSDQLAEFFLPETEIVEKEESKGDLFNAELRGAITSEQHKQQCPPTLAERQVEWRRGSELITAILPHMEANTCTPPMKCQTSATVHRVIDLQEGDSLQIKLQLFPKVSNSTANDSTISQLESTKEGGTEAPTHLFGRLDYPQPFLVANNSNGKNGNKENMVNSQVVSTSKFITSSLPRHAQAHKFASSFLKIWKVTEPEWTTCSTREGGKVTESRRDGIVVIDEAFLLPGTQFFIGRSSWSSSECFKLKVVVRPVDCGDGSICSGKGICFTNSSLAEYSCGCCEEFSGKHCEERNGCYDAPCLNKGICLDIDEGHDGNTFQCLCPYGFRGKICEELSSLCDSNPCQNGGFCEGNHTFYSCHCSLGWTGPQCMDESSYDFEKDEGFGKIYDEALDFGGSGCSAEPCVHGVCVETTDKDFTCFCQQGFGGKRCEFQYDECCSSPCQNEGICVDGIGDYKCHCGPGYTGRNCLEKLNLCEPNPCPLNKNCVDKGNIVTCECFDDDFSSDECDDYEEECNPNPCNHGGSCYTIAETLGFYCACRPGYTGQTCQDNSILESVMPIGATVLTDIDAPQKVLSNSLSHLKNMYTGILTLTCAFLLFLCVLSICHCMVKHENNCRLSILRLIVRLLPSFLFRRRSDSVIIDKRSRSEECTSLRLDSDSECSSSAPMSSNTTGASVFYNMDVCDNQPLIK